MGTNRLTILPTGWVHSQDNIKTVLSRPKVIHAENPALARELGINRYERIQDFDFSTAETYWAKTSEYWAKVRSAWAEHLSVSDTVKVATMCGEERVYKKLFALATDVSDGTAPSGKKLMKKIDSIMSVPSRNRSVVVARDPIPGAKGTRPKRSRLGDGGTLPHRADRRSLANSRSISARRHSRRIRRTACVLGF